MKLVALTRPVPGREAEFEDWYANTHLPELVNTLGMEGAQRYKLVAKLTGSDPNEFMAIYDIEGDDPMEFLAAMGAMSKSGEMTPSDAQDMGTTYAALFTEHGDRMVPG